SLPGCVGKAFTPMRPMKGPLGKTTLKTIFHAKPCQALFLRVTLNSYSGTIFGAFAAAEK
ncbi:MAG: hypothetical protein Q8S55_13850, partial [Methylococcaceae bacterium]|nr:hypothetical protein [Methylococcaceae bacterium]